MTCNKSNSQGLDNAVASKHKQHGFTLAELLMGLMIAAIVLGAAATMSEAMSSGKRETENMTRTATYLAQINTRLSDVIMQAEHIDGYTNNVLLTFNNGQNTARIYTDDEKRIIVEKDGDPERKHIYLYKTFSSAAGQPVAMQKNVRIEPDTNTVTIELTLEDQNHILSATRRGGQ